MCKMIHTCWEPQGQSNAKYRPTLVTHIQLLQGDSPANMSPAVLKLRPDFCSAAPPGSLSKLPNSRLVKPIAATAAALMESSRHRASRGTCRAMFTIAQSLLLHALLMSSLKVVALAERRAWEGSFLRKEEYQRYLPASLLTSSFPNFFKPSVKLLTP